MKSKKVSVSLNQYELDLFNEAVDTTSRPAMRDDMRDLVLRLSIISVSREIIRQGAMVLPMAVDLRLETNAETEARVHKIIPERGSAPVKLYVRNPRLEKNIVPFPLPRAAAGKTAAVASGKGQP